jgi:uncharacterized protein (DUF983 family)
MPGSPFGGKRMSVILSKEDTFAAGKDDKCAICGEGYLYPPYVFWFCDNNLYFCEKCCRDLRGSLVADFIQVIAIRDLQSIGYRNSTLMRETQATADKEAKENNPTIIAPANRKVRNR